MKWGKCGTFVTAMLNVMGMTCDGRNKTKIAHKTLIVQVVTGLIL